MKNLTLSWMDPARVSRTLVLALTILALLSGIGTYTVFARAGAAGPDPNVVLAFMYINLGLLLILGILVSQRVVRLWVQRRQGLAGSQLHIRLVMLFSVVAVIPTMVVAVFSVVLFDFGIRSWFSERIGAAVDASQAVAESYLEEHRQNIRGDALAMANDLNRNAAFLFARPKQFAKVIQAQAAIRNLTEAVVFDSSGKVLARTGLSLTFDFDPFPETAFQKARLGDVITLTSAVDRVRAIIRLNSFVDAYLYVGRFVDPEILSYIDTTKQATAQYRELEGRRFDVQITFALIFALVALLLLFAAVWVGLNLATRLANPVSDLIAASEKISEGDLTVRVIDSSEVGELSMLSGAFNNMTQRLERQRKDLIEAHKAEDERRKFTEAVLGGVSAGVIGLDKNGEINLPNLSAASLLGLELDDMIRRPLREIVPEMNDLLELTRLHRENSMEAQIELIREQRPITLITRIKAEYIGNDITGFVVTFDDITELQAAQRTAAWGDIARRIAHEIKNPLTPIQLSAERLKRKYLPHIVNERELFISLTDTISRQVTDIGQMVDEFSAFARMPTAVRTKVDLVHLAKAQIALQSSAHTDIEFTIDASENTIFVMCDERQIRQALTNLLQNSVDSIGTKNTLGLPNKDKIHMEIYSDLAYGAIKIRDNGVGLPKEYTNRLTEPYVTTREKGTGLGLAIVSKIVEDHDGTFKIEDDTESGTGAIVTLKIPLESRMN
ncbi:MAG: two-component sensor histidine kinase [Rhodospirillaceae bacterium]|nr:two-component sensor histidine kinase [Rhodospirillaceae bacterium]